MKLKENDLFFDSQTDIKNPRDYRWLVCLLCALAFLFSFRSVAYGADSSFNLISATYGVTDYGTDKVDFVLSQSGVTYTFTLKDIDSSYKNYFIGYKGGSLRFVLLDSSSEVYCEDSSDWVVFRDTYTNLFYLEEGVTEYIEYGNEGSCNFVIDSDGYIVTSTVDIYRKGGDLFFQAPPPWTILTGVTITSPLAQILTVLGTVLTVIVVYLAMRKAIQMILALLRAS